MDVKGLSEVHSLKRMLLNQVGEWLESQAWNSTLETLDLMLLPVQQYYQELSLGSENTPIPTDKVTLIFTASLSWNSLPPRVWKTWIQIPTLSMGF